MKSIYLDNAATTRVKKEVLRAMLPFFSEQYGNPSSQHAMGEEALRALTEARKGLARELDCKAHELIFTSGGTESNALALRGVLEASRKKKIVISNIEHSSVRETAQALKKEGIDVVEVNVDREGRIRTDELESAIDGKTALVSVIHANNEIGTLQNTAAIGKLCKERGVLFHTDAVQSFGKECINVRAMNIDLLSASAHKIGGLKGIGLLYVREGIPLRSLFPGAQEAGRRAGTENVPAAVGFAKALELTKKTNLRGMNILRHEFMDELEKLGGVINGSHKQRLANNIHVTLQNIDAEMLVLFLSQHQIFCSTRSACLTQQRKESHVLKAIGLTEKEIRGSLRFTLGDDTTRKDLQRVLAIITKFLRRQ